MLSSLDDTLPCSATRPSLERARLVPSADYPRSHTWNQASRAGNDLLNGSPKTRQNIRPSRCGRSKQLIARGNSGASCDTITRTDSTWASTAPPVDDARTLGVSHTATSDVITPSENAPLGNPAPPQAAWLAVRRSEQWIGRGAKEPAAEEPEHVRPRPGGSSAIAISRPAWRTTRPRIVITVSGSRRTSPSGALSNAGSRSHGSTYRRPVAPDDH